MKKWYGAKSKLYHQYLADLFRENFINYVCSGFLIGRVNAERCVEIANSFDKPVKFYEQTIGNIVKDLLEKNTEKRAEIRDFSDFDKTKYVQDFFDLSSITLPYDAASIRNKLVSAKKCNGTSIENVPVTVYEIVKKSKRGTNYVLEEDDSL